MMWHSIFFNVSRRYFFWKCLHNLKSFWAAQGSCSDKTFTILKAICKCCSSLVLTLRVWTLFKRSKLWGMRKTTKERNEENNERKGMRKTTKEKEWGKQRKKRNEENDERKKWGKRRKKRNEENNERKGTRKTTKEKEWGKQRKKKNEENNEIKGMRQAKQINWGEAKTDNLRFITSDRNTVLHPVSSCCVRY